jgi:hypothetical protein
VIRFFDASAWVKRYADEPDSPIVETLVTTGRPVVCRLTEVETASALCRRAREQTLTRDARNRALAALQEDLRDIHVIEITREVCQRAVALLANHPLRAPDAIQLAACLVLQERSGAEIELVCFDARMAHAARLEGIPSHR